MMNSDYSYPKSGNTFAPEFNDSDYRHADAIIPTVCELPVSVAREKAYVVVVKVEPTKEHITWASVIPSARRQKIRKLNEEIQGAQIAPEDSTD
jgi:hypothetical protein